VLAEPIVRLLYQHGKFGVSNTETVTFALQCLVPGLVAFSAVNILARAFYALGDTTTPMKISLVCLALNFTLACGLMYWLRAGGPGLANTLTSALNAYLLLHALRKKLGRLEMQELRQTVLPLALTCLAAGLIAWVLRLAWTAHLGHDSLPTRLGEVFVPAGLAGGFYLLVALALHVPAAAEMRDLLRQRLGR
jgi:putative peptidoglycan lipid II flippase